MSSADLETAEALVTEANAALQSGHLDVAATKLDGAARLFRALGHAEDESRCAHLSATVWRLRGDLDAAEVRARQATTLGAATTPSRVAAWIELGEIAMARRDGAHAEAAFGAALEAGVGLLPIPRGALLRRRAEALLLGGNVAHAADWLAMAADTFAEGGDHSAARRVRVEQAGARLRAGQQGEARRLHAEVLRDAESASDAAALAEVELLGSTLALTTDDVEAAWLAARRAQAHALTAVAPVSYLAATLAMAELAERMGEKLAAYESLAAGWATLADLLGADAARASFAPALRAQQARWGAPEFQRIKQRYEERCRETR